MTNRINKVLHLVPLLLILLIVTGCPGPEQQAQQKPEAQQKTKIGVSLASMEFDGNQTIKKLMDERAKKDKVKLIWTDAKMDPAQQEKDVDKLIKQKVKTIILQAVDPIEGATLVDKIVQAKIKVIGLETLPLNAPLDGYVAADHVRAGELQGKYVLMQIDGQASSSSSNQNQGNQQQQDGQSGGQQGQQQALVGKNNVKVLILKGDPSDPVSTLIARGAEDILKQSKNIEQIKIEEHPQGDPNMAQMTVQNILKAGTIDAILATDDRIADAAIKALKSQNMAQQVVTVGVGADQKITQALSEGDHDAEIDIMPEQLANFALDAAQDLADKGNWNFDSRIQNGNYDIPSKIIPVRLIEKDQVQLLEARWGKQKQQSQQQQGGGEQQGGQSQQGSPEGGSQEGSQGASQGGSQQGQGSGGQGKKSKLKIVTQDGKVMEVEVDGEIQKIEQDGGGGEQGQQGEQGGGQQGGQ